MANWLTKNVELLERIGLGATGEVWKAHHHVSPTVAPTVIAVKRIFGRATKEECDRLFLEARVLEKMHHANVVRFLFAGLSDSCEPFLALEFVEGATLDEHLKLFPSGRLPLDSAAHLARQIAAAIDYVASHAEVSNGSRKYLVHGDLKPRNLLVTPAGVLKVIDFGSARRVNPEVTNTLTGVEFTPRYSPPEVDGGVGSKITEYFSLGAIYFEMLTGKKAIDGETLLKRLEARNKFYLRRNVAQREKCLREAGVDTETAQLVQGLLAKKTRERERSFRLLICQRAGQRVRETFGFGEEVFTPPPAKSRTAIWLGAIAVAAAVAILFVSSRMRPSADKVNMPAPPEALVPVAEVMGPPAPVSETVMISFPSLVIRVPEIVVARAKQIPPISLPDEVKVTSLVPPRRYPLPPPSKKEQEEAIPSGTHLVPVEPGTVEVVEQPLTSPVDVVAVTQVPHPVVELPPLPSPPLPRAPANEVQNLLPPPKIYADDTASFN